MRLVESLISSVFGLNVTPKKEIFLFFIFDPKILWTLFVSKFTLSWLDFITDFTTDKFYPFLGDIIKIHEKYGWIPSTQFKIKKNVSQGNKDGDITYVFVKYD